MAIHPVTHPSADVLRAFALGKLNDCTTSAVMSHLDSCAECCKHVAAMSGDDFLDRLRQAHGRSSTPSPANALSESIVGSQPPRGEPAIPSLPPELASNP